MDTYSEVGEDFLEHYGVKGMKWGVRKDTSGALSGVPRSTNREARKDAKESARAKMFYGQGAGTRRKLINNSVAAKSKRDPAYKKAFDHHYEQQNLANHASKARGERKRKDVASNTARTARGVKNLVMQNGAPVTVAAVAVYSASQNPAVRKVVKDLGDTTLKTVRDFQSKQRVNDWAKKSGF